MLINSTCIITMSLLSKDVVRSLALSNGFKLKTQPDGSEELNPYVYDFAEALASTAIKTNAAKNADQITDADRLRFLAECDEDGELHDELYGLPYEEWVIRIDAAIRDLHNRDNEDSDDEDDEWDDWQDFTVDLSSDKDNGWSKVVACIMTGFAGYAIALAVAEPHAVVLGVAVFVVMLCVMALDSML